MAKEPSHPRKWIVVAAILLVVGAAGVYAILPRDRKPASTLPPELQPEALRARMEQGGPGGMREIMNRDDLTDEQRRELRDNLRQSWQAALRERVDEYFVAADDQKQAVLDKHIDEFMKRMEDWRREQPNQQPPSDAERERMRRTFADRSQQERKEESESRNPDDMARSMAYFMAAQARAKERGIEMPRGPGFGRGGPGGGAEGGPGRGGSPGQGGGGTSPRPRSSGGGSRP